MDESTPNPSASAPEQPSASASEQPGASEVASDATAAPSARTHGIVVVGPDGQPIGRVETEESEEGEDPRSMVEQPAKVMRIGSMIKQLLDEVKDSPLDEAARNRLREIHSRSVKELENGLAPELVEELERLSLPFSEDSTPSEAELRIAQAQLVGWLEGLFHGIQAAMFAQQAAARAAFDEVRKRAIGAAEAEERPSGGATRSSGPYL